MDKLAFLYLSTDLSDFALLLQLAGGCRLSSYRRLVLAMEFAQRMISVRLVEIGPIFTKLAFITCPIAAFLIWQQHDYLKAGIALLWTLVVNLIDLLVSPIEVLLRIRENSALDIGPVQKRLLQGIGYVKAETVKTKPVPNAISRASEAGPPTSASQANPAPSRPTPTEGSTARLAKLEEHRRLRHQTSQNSLGFWWTRSSNGSLITEEGQYWIEIERDKSGGFGFVVYRKDSGASDTTWLAFATEQEAIETAQYVLRSRQEK